MPEITGYNNTGIKNILPPNRRDMNKLHQYRKHHKIYAKINNMEGRKLSEFTEVMPLRAKNQKLIRCKRKRDAQYLRQGQNEQVML